MATARFSCFASLPLLYSSHPPSLKLNYPESFFKPATSARNLKCGRQLLCAVGNEFLGDFGARDPFPAEIESNFGEKVVGNLDTEHRILIPNLSALSLAQQVCSPVSPSQPPMTEDEAQALLRKIVGWRLVDDQGILKLQCTWKLRDFKCGAELINRVCGVAEAAGHYPNLLLEQPNQVKAELWTNSIGGLSMNDFILAAKIDEVKTSDLVPKKRIWA